jgi:small subunit ribosomal protein S24e
MADLEVLQKKENVLLKRTEVTFRITHPKEKTPQRDAVRDKVAAAVGAKKEGVIIDHLRSRFGVAVTLGYAKVYPSADAAKKTESVFLLRRHGLVEEKKKTEGAAPAKKEEKAAAKPAERKK